MQTHEWVALVAIILGGGVILCLTRMVVSIVMISYMVLALYLIGSYIYAGINSEAYAAANVALLGIIS